MINIPLIGHDKTKLLKNPIAEQATMNDFGTPRNFNL